MNAKTTMFAGLVLAVAMCGQPVRGEVSGAFVYNEHRFEPAHVYALRVDEPGSENTKLLFSGEPLEIGLRYLDNSSQAVLETLDRHYVLIVSLDAQGSYIGHVLAGGDPQVYTTGMLGGSEFALRENDDARIAGSWSVGEPLQVVDNTYNVDLEFEAAIADPKAKARELSAGGGEPGRAYLEFLDNVRTGSNVESMRRFVNIGVMLSPERSKQELQEDIDYLRSSLPSSAKVTGGLADDQAAILHVDAVSAEGATEKLHVTVNRTADGWEY